MRKAREYVGQDRQTFAETIGIHRDTLAKYEETGKAKRSTLISVAWATPVRLEWLESGALPWLDNEKAPVRGGTGASLPDLDSNQEPIGFESAPIWMGDYRKAKTSAHQSVASDRDATITQLPHAAGH